MTITPAMLCAVPIYARDEGTGEVQRRLPSSLETHYHSDRVAVFGQIGVLGGHVRSSGSLTKVPVHRPFAETQHKSVPRIRAIEKVDTWQESNSKS